MGFARFYGHFAAAYGTFWLVLLLFAFLSRSHIDAGAFGMFGFPIMAFLYALMRTPGGASELDPPDEVARLRERVARLEGALGGRTGEVDDLS